MKIVILDTNFIMYSCKNNIRIEEEILRELDSTFSLATLDKCIEELKRLSKEAYNYANKLRLTIIKSNNQEETADFNLLNIADSNTIIATNDRQLKENLKKRNFPVFVIRQKNHIKLI